MWSEVQLFHDSYILILQRENRGDSSSRRAVPESGSRRCLHSWGSSELPTLSKECLMRFGRHEETVVARPLWRLFSRKLSGYGLVLTWDGRPDLAALAPPHLQRRSEQHLRVCRCNLRNEKNGSKIWLPVWFSPWTTVLGKTVVEFGGGGSWERKMVSELRGLSSTRRCAGTDAR
jgi:hypothetical protein